MAMQRWFWALVLLGALLLGAVVACGGPGNVPASAVVAEQATVPGTEGLDPVPLYSLDMSLLTAEHRLRGRQQVRFPNRTGTDLDEIVFRLYPNLPQYRGRIDIGPVLVNGKRTLSRLRQEDTSLVIPLARTLPPEGSVTISFTFGVEIPRPESPYVLFGQSQGIWSLPGAYPLLAVHDGSGWHEDMGPAYADATFADIAYYSVNLTLPPTMTLVTTGAIVSDSVQVATGRLYHIEGGPWREFAWLASADYQVASAIACGTTVRSYYLPGDEAAGQSALTIAAASLRVYSDEYGAYPFPEMTVVEAPLAYYGQEYPGLNLIGVDLYRDKREELEIRVAHEIAHQWWYSQVGNDQLNTPWLDEGLAEHSTSTYYRRAFGAARANALINQRWELPYQSAVSNGRDAVVNQPSTAFGETYEVTVYAKAALFFEALRQELGDEVFRRVLEEYLIRFRWRIAVPEDFLAVVKAVSGKDVDALYTRWVLTKQ
jgi:hypothetical protein